MTDLGATTKEASAALAPRPVTVRLNALQRLMHRWTLTAAYNAGQAMQVTGTGDLARWRQAIDATLHETGLCAPEIDRHSFATFDIAKRGPGIAALTTMPAGTTLNSLYNTELQVPFHDGEVPLRFFIVPRNDGSHYLAAVYDHWVADSRAMRSLMQRIFVRYQQPERPSSLPPLKLDAPPFLELFGRHFKPWLPWTIASFCIRGLWHHRNAHRMHLYVPNDYQSHLLYEALPEGLITRVRAYAKKHDASVNDLFLALMGQVMGEFTAVDRANKRRRLFHFRKNKVGLGTIVDIRGQAAANLDDVFGLYLSSYTVLLKNPEKQSLPVLMKTIADDTVRYKKGGGTVRAFSAMVAASMFWHLYRPHNHTQMFHKTVPVISGISNVNMTGSWVDRPRPADLAHTDPPEILDYLRISPAGPLIPLVFTLTTINQRLSLCMTYRTTAFTDEQGQQILRAFVSRLAAL